MAKIFKLKKQNRLVMINGSKSAYEDRQSKSFLIFKGLRASGLSKEIGTNSVSTQKFNGKAWQSLNQFLDAVNCIYERSMFYCDVIIQL